MHPDMWHCVLNTKYTTKECGSVEYEKYNIERNNKNNNNNAGAV